jgi:D-serine deaminase-like pyridoxal phosphate-dependent protein
MPISPAELYARALIGQPGSRWRLPTPALVVDLGALDANIGRMAARAKAAGVGLRPHAKTHKSAFIARRQIAAGAVGVCCAKVGEAEALAEAGIRGILVTSPIASPETAERCAVLAAQDPDFAVAVDHPVGADALQAAAAARNTTIHLVIDVDVGMGRTGVADTAAGLALGQRIAAQPNLRLKGIQGYGGAWQHLVGADKRLEAAKAGLSRLTELAAALRADGHACPLITGGGTGTFEADTDLGVLTERQPGSYVFMDNQYVDALGGDPDGAFQTSLFVQAQVVSANARRWVTVDAGLKAFATDGPPPRPATAPFASDAYFFFGDEHGGLMRPAGGEPIAHGQRVELKVPHCDPTVDRYSWMHMVRGEVLESIEPIEAARRSQ